MNNSAKKPSGNGFTLVELLVSMAITTIIITALVSITAISLEVWNKSRAEVRATAQGEAMLDSMAADFESMVVRSGNSFQWLHAESETPSDGPRDNTSPNGVKLIFFSAATDRYDGRIGEVEDEGGDVSTIAYELAYTDPVGGDTTDNEKFKTFVLYRKIVDPDDTFDDLLGQTDLESAFNTSNPTIDAPENFICENIYQFTVTFHVETTNASDEIVSIPITIDQNTANEQFILTGNGITYPDTSELNAILTAADVTEAKLQSGRLTAVEIYLSVLSDSGLAQMKGRNIDSQFIAENSFQYSKLIPVPSY